MPSKGVKSTEFWVLVLTGILMVANGTSWVEVPWDQFTVWMAANGLYIGARTTEKSIAHKSRKETGHDRS